MILKICIAVVVSHIKVCKFEYMRKYSRWGLGSLCVGDYITFRWNLFKLLRLPLEDLKILFFEITDSYFIMENGR